MPKSLQFYRTPCDKSFYHFVKIIGGSVNRGADASRAIHKPLCDFLQDPTHRRPAIAMPRMWRKSTILTKWFTIWSYLQNPGISQIIVSETEKRSKEFLKTIKKHLLRNEMLRKVYKDILGEVDASWTKNNQWEATACELPRYGLGSSDDPSISAIGVGGAAQGGHYDIIHIDDSVGKKAMDSIVVLEDVFRWFDNVEELTIDPDWTSINGSKICVIGTHWASGDFFCYVQEKYPEYKWKVVPCRKDVELQDTKNIEWLQHPDQENGETNYPEQEKFSTQHYIDMAANPEKELVYWAQHMNNPHKASGLSKFDFQWIHWYRFEETDDGLYVVCRDDGEMFKLSEMQLYGMIDPGGFAEVKTTKGSRLAMLMGGQPRGTIKKFVIWQWAGKFKTPSEMMRILFHAQEKWKPRLWQIETIGSQRYIYYDILEAKKKECPALRITPMKVTPEKGDKTNDITALINPIANGEIYLHDSMKELIGEIKNFPHGLTCDLLDMLGKLNKFHWQRRALPKKSHWDYKELEDEGSGRSSYTGY